MNENQLKMKKYEEYFDFFRKTGKITKNERDILDSVFRKILGLKKKN